MSQSHASASVRVSARRPDILPQQIEQALNACGGAAVSCAKAVCPVDTGRLRDSITFQVDTDAKTVTVGTAVPYAVYVEFGHRAPSGAVCPAGPFIKPSVADHADVYRDIIEDILSGG